jgi:hypothetical protein
VKRGWENDLYYISFVSAVNGYIIGL